CSTKKSLIFISCFKFVTMENFEEDIRNFDRLEQGDLKNDPVLQSINQLDALMQKTSVKAPQEDFVGRVMSSAVVAIRKRKQFRFFTTLAGVMVALFVVLFMALSGQ